MRRYRNWIFDMEMLKKSGLRAKIIRVNYYKGDPYIKTWNNYTPWGYVWLRFLKFPYLNVKERFQR